jgi:thioredoxin-like negative regulator of GroEL
MPRPDTLADRVLAISLRESSSDPVVALAELRRARAAAQDGPPSSRCQIALALAVTLSIAGRSEEALLDALDALACARESKDPKAVGACVALLARLYASAGFPDAATRLRADAT